MTLAWSNEHIYKDLACPEFIADYEAVLASCEQISGLSSRLVESDESQAVALLQNIQQSLDKCGTTLAELRAYVFGHLAIDGSDHLGQKWQGKLNKAQGELDSATSAFKRFLATCGQAVIDEFLAEPNFAEQAFQIKRLRPQASSLLTEEAEEVLISCDQQGWTLGALAIWPQQVQSALMWRSMASKRL